LKAALRLRPSDLRHRVRIEQGIVTSDGAGGRSVTWALFEETWAWIAPLTGEEKFLAEQLEDKITHTIRMRFRDGITPSMRITFEDRVFNIRAVLNPEERDWVLTLLCDEGVG
jgi:SPP1 family predicted phage head-tail adaptor